MTQFRLLPLGSSNIASFLQAIDLFCFTLCTPRSPPPHPPNQRVLLKLIILSCCVSALRTVFFPWEWMSREEQDGLVGATRLINAESFPARQKSCLQRNFAVCRRRETPAPVPAPPATSPSIIFPDEDEKSSPHVLLFQIEIVLLPSPTGQVNSGTKEDKTTKDFSPHTHTHTPTTPTTSPPPPLLSPSQTFPVPAPWSEAGRDPPALPKPGPEPRPGDGGV